MILRRTCKETTALLLAREDRRLSMADRLAVKVHLAVCNNCPKFENQLRVMRQAMQNWRNYSDE
jgi:Putative zinc-finger